MSYSSLQHQTSTATTQTAASHLSDASFAERLAALEATQADIATCLATIKALCATDADKPAKSQPTNASIAERLAALKALRAKEADKSARHQLPRSTAAIQSAAKQPLLTTAATGLAAAHSHAAGTEDIRANINASLTGITGTTTKAAVASNTSIFAKSGAPDHTSLFTKITIAQPCVIISA
ncbi:hypothetical protein LPJ73_002488 [Coemansia sp. RSA 2703]|nr:hypothetical protein LPJ73_002488 [Coemansia sp. RSA 2703]